LYHLLFASSWVLVLVPVGEIPGFVDHYPIGKKKKKKKPT